MPTPPHNPSQKHPRQIAITVALLCALLPSSTPAADWQLALPGWHYEFPRDHHLHPAFKTEWWYFTGRLLDEKGGEYGYQVTFFRQGLRPPQSSGNPTSRFVVNDLKFAHFALSDIGKQHFQFAQKISRGAFNDAGFDNAQHLAWIDNWTLDLLPHDGFALQAADGPAQLQLQLENTKPLAIHGQDGASQKAEGIGHASHYYSGTRLATSGTLTLNGAKLIVHGESWLDREWGSNQLTPEQVGWNWFSLQLDDNTELMLYRMRRRDGTLDPNSSGTFIARDGTTQHLTREDYQLAPSQYWTSDASGGRYPIAWQLTVPKLNLSAEISTPLKSQELFLKPVAYWEGLIEIHGTRDSAKVAGHGYMELTGYAGALVGLSETAPNSASPK